MSEAHTLTAERLSAAIEWMDGDAVSGPLPAGQPARFDRRVSAVMHATGRDRTWSRQRAAEQWPEEVDAYLAAKAA